MPIYGNRTHFFKILKLSVLLKACVLDCLSGMVNSYRKNRDRINQSIAVLEGNDASIFQNGKFLKKCPTIPKCINSSVDQIESTGNDTRRKSSDTKRWAKFILVNFTVKLDLFGLNFRSVEFNDLIVLLRNNCLLSFIQTIFFLF